MMDQLFRDHTSLFVKFAMTFWTNSDLRIYPPMFPAKAHHQKSWSLSNPAQFYLNLRKTGISTKRVFFRLSFRVTGQTCCYPICLKIFIYLLSVDFKINSFATLQSEALDKNISKSSHEPDESDEGRHQGNY